MTEINKWTCANRKETVLAVRILELLDGDLMRPKIEHLGPADSEDIKRAVQSREKLWAVHVTTKPSFDSERTFLQFFACAENAENAVSEYPIGAEIDFWEDLRPKSRDFETGKLSIETAVSILGRGEPPYFLIYDALHGAGVYENFKTSKEVLNWLGNEGAQWLASEYGENWEVVAVMEYCVRHFPATSLACMAARVMVADFISDGDYDTGYASRELEVLAGGAENLAQKALDAQAQRAKAGDLPPAGPSLMTRVCRFDFGSRRFRA
ncbi:hypothetical protein, partial [Marinovum algicola]|uniref:hypothetical protein n=1 Tax=Marinovum algicola TaxID=42444 RepID=UPI0024B9CB24